MAAKLLAIAVLCSSSVLPEVAGADGAPADPDAQSEVSSRPGTDGLAVRLARRELGGHVFFPSLVTTDPFVSTFASVSAGAGYAWIDGPGFDRLGNLLGSRAYRAGELSEGIGFQWGPIDSLAIRFAGGGGLDGGINAASALVVGLVQPISVGGGATYSWQLNRISRFGIAFDGSYTHLLLIEPLSAVAASIASARIDLSRLSQRQNTSTLSPGVNIAIAPCPSVGLLASATYTWFGPDTAASGGAINEVSLAASAQLDLSSQHVPMGFLLSYRSQIPFESGVRFTHTIEGGIYYTGRRDIDLGVDVQLRWFDLRPDSRFPLDTTQLLTEAVLRYYWN